MMGWYFLSQHKRKMFTHYKRTAVENTHPQQQSDILINLVTDDDLLICTGQPNPSKGYMECIQNLKYSIIQRIN